MDHKRRVRHACARCRRQKLKCDNTRPCQLCTRSGFECLEATEQTRRSNRRKPEARRNYRPSPHEPCLRSQKSELRVSVEQASTRNHVNSIQSQERSSTFNLVEQLFKKYSSRPKSSDAIPDGAAANCSSEETAKLTFKELSGIELPPLPLIHDLIDSYIKSSQWYCTVVYPPLFRAQLAPILESGLAYPSDKQFVMLFLAVMHNGATFILLQQAEGGGSWSTADLVALQSKIMVAINRGYLECCEDLSLHGIGFLFILSNVYLGQKKTKLAFSVLGMAIRAAQAIGLYKETSWGPLCHQERQLRRAMWWSLYMTDSYSAQMFGKPSIIHERDCQVQLPDDFDDSAKSCPGFQSLEQREDGTYQPVTEWSYHRYKIKLYLIAAPITRHVYSKKDGNTLDDISRVRMIHRQLQDWERQVPPELRPDSFAGRTDDDDDIRRDPTVRAFALQSLTLQAVYDSIRLLLFRPFIGLLDREPPPGPPAASSELTRQAEQDMLAMSRDQCWISSMRLSQAATRHPAVLRLIYRNTALMQWVMWCLTAGVMLGVLAMSSSTRRRTDECKRAIARLVRSIRGSDCRAPLVVQAADILADLVRLVSSQEAEAMISAGGDDDDDDGGGGGGVSGRHHHHLTAASSSRESTVVPLFGLPPAPLPPLAPRHEQSGLQGPGAAANSTDGENRASSDSSLLREAPSTAPGISFPVEHNGDVNDVVTGRTAALVENARFHDATLLSPTISPFQGDLPSDATTSTISAATAGWDDWRSAIQPVTAQQEPPLCESWLEDDDVTQMWIWNREFSFI